MFKILTMRLSNIMKCHRILKGHNFAALKGESCFGLIKIAQSILEDARRMLDVSNEYIESIRLSQW